MSEGLKTGETHLIQTEVVTKAGFFWTVGPISESRERPMTGNRDGSLSREVATNAKGCVILELLGELGSAGPNVRQAGAG